MKLSEVGGGGFFEILKFQKKKIGWALGQLIWHAVLDNPEIPPMYLSVKEPAQVIGTPELDGFC